MQLSMLYLRLAAPTLEHSLMRQIILSREILGILSKGTGIQKGDVQGEIARRLGRVAKYSTLRLDSRHRIFHDTL